MPMKTTVLWLCMVIPDNLPQNRHAKLCMVKPANLPNRPALHEATDLPTGTTPVIGHTHTHAH